MFEYEGQKYYPVTVGQRDHIASELGPFSDDSDISWILSALDNQRMEDFEGLLEFTEVDWDWSYLTWEQNTLLEELWSMLEDGSLAREPEIDTLDDLDLDGWDELEPEPSSMNPLVVGGVAITALIGGAYLLRKKG